MTKEIFYIAILDSGCPKTVRGEVWLEVYMDLLKEKPNVTQSDSNASFKFGNGRSIKSNRKVEIPVIIEDSPVLLLTGDVISFDIPLLLSKESMKRANTVIDFKNDYVELFRKNINLFFTSSGHYCILIKNVTNNLETNNLMMLIMH